MPKIENHVGNRVGKLLVIGAAVYIKGRRHWVCRCDCGSIKVQDTGSLTGGRVKSCGCHRKEKFTERVTKHGSCGTRLHKIWGGMRYRCNSPQYAEYYYYGGKGIRVCEEWKDFKAFEKWSMENGYTEDLTIDRIDSEKDYSPENCEWVTPSENARRASMKRHYGNNWRQLKM